MVATFHARVTIDPNPFSYDVSTHFYAQVTFTNSNRSNVIPLSVLDSKGGYFIKDASITNSQPYVTDILDLNVTYVLELTEGNQSARPS